MTEKVFIFTFSVKDVSDQQAAELLGQIAEWAAMNNAWLSAGFAEGTTEIVAKTKVLSA
jgi:hypothetical protein